MEEISSIGKRKEMETSEPEPTIVLTSEEQALFTVLSEVVDHFKLNAVLRVAGGWVRDKLMVQIHMNLSTSTITVA